MSSSTQNDNLLEGLVYQNQRYLRVTPGLQSVLRDALTWRYSLQHMGFDVDPNDLAYVHSLLNLASQENGLPDNVESEVLRFCQSVSAAEMSPPESSFAPVTSLVPSIHTTTAPSNESSSTLLVSSSPSSQMFNVAAAGQSTSTLSTFSDSVVPVEVSAQQNPLSPANFSDVEQVAPDSLLPSAEDDWINVESAIVSADDWINVDSSAFVDVDDYEDSDEDDYGDEHLAKRRKTINGDKSLGVPANPGDDPNPPRYGGDKRGCQTSRGRGTRARHSVMEPSPEFRNIIHSLGRVGTESGEKDVFELINACAGLSLDNVGLGDDHDPLVRAVKDLIRASSNQSINTIAYIVACVNFAALACQDGRLNSVAFKDIRRRLGLRISVRQLYTWFSLGVRYGVFMQAGGVHIIFLIVALDVRSSFEKLFVEDVSNLASFIRTANCHADVTSSRIIERTLIPFTHRMRRVFLLNVAGATGADLELDDRTLNARLSKTNTYNVLLATRHAGWLMPVQIPSNVMRFDCGLHTVSIAPLYPTNYAATRWLEATPSALQSSRMEYPAFINMKIDLSHPCNAMPPAALQPCRKGFKWEAAEQWTTRERAKVFRENTVRISSVEELREVLQSNAVTETGRRRDRYVYVPSGLNTGVDIVINTASTSSTTGMKPTVILLRDDYMQEELKDRIWNSIMLRIDELEEYELESEGNTDQEEKKKFKVRHMDMWARYLEKAKETTPKSAFPRLIPGNRSQRLPHPSAEMRRMYEKLDKITADLGDVYDVIERKIRKYFPDEAFDLEQTIDALPGCDSPASPSFLGLVININAFCRAHRDEGDLHFCIVIPFGNFKGGELVLYELGLVFQLKCGDILIFDSVSLTHFNLDFEGKRGSLVLHSDRSIKNFMRNQNGWGEHLN